jgi:murein DD-endopeptidase MepM/ murein hydrolase activator NlpD
LGRTGGEQATVRKIAADAGDDRNMRLRHRHWPLPAVLCLLTCLAAVPAARAADGRAEPGAEVARLFQEAAQAAAVYEQGRAAARTQRAEAERLERMLASERAETAVIHAELGRLARAQYRTGGGLPYTAQLLLAEDPGELMRGRRAAWQADLAVARALSRSQHAERRLARREQRAAAAWRDLNARTAELEQIKNSIETKLEEAQRRLQGEADGGAAAAQCAGALRLSGKPPTDGPDWVKPVEEYELSAGFDRVGEHWASRHTGQDFAVPIGTPVRSVGAGRVTSVSCGGAFGIEVIVWHNDGYYTQYAHLASVTVERGQRVLPGQQIGQAGTTGNSTGPHLHFEVRLTPRLGSAVDPEGWLRKRGVKL